jgi:hypothetical protein
VRARHAHSGSVANVLGLRRGDLVEIEVLEGRRGTRRVPVVGVIQSYIGMSAYMRLDVLNELLDEGPTVSGIHFSYDSSAEPQLFAAIKKTAAIGAIALQRLSLAKFRETLAQNINIMVGFYVGLAVIVAFGVVYNSARIQLSENARDLASLRMLGFTRGEVSLVLLLELAILVLLAQPLCWALGYAFGWLVIESFSSDIYRAPFIIRSYVSVAAPVVGRVLKVLQESEQVVLQGTPLVEVGDPENLELVVELLSSEAVRVRPGVAAIVEGWGGLQLAAKVDRVEPAGFTKVSALGIEEQRVNVVLSLIGEPGQRRRLGHDYRVFVRIIVHESANALLVPLGALFRHGEAWAVFVAERSRAQVRIIEVGARNAQHAEVVGGE